MGIRFENSQEERINPRFGGVGCNVGTDGSGEFVAGVRSSQSRKGQTAIGDVLRNALRGCKALLIWAKPHTWKCETELEDKSTVDETRGERISGVFGVHAPRVANVDRGRGDQGKRGQYAESQKIHSARTSAIGPLVRAQFLVQFVGQCFPEATKKGSGFGWQRFGNGWQCRITLVFRMTMVMSRSHIFGVGI